MIAFVSIHNIHPFAFDIIIFPWFVGITIFVCLFVVRHSILMLHLAFCICKAYIWMSIWMPNRFRAFLFSICMHFESSFFSAQLWLFFPFFFFFHSSVKRMSSVRVDVFFFFGSCSVFQCNDFDWKKYPPECIS